MALDMIIIILGSGNSGESLELHPVDKDRHVGLFGAGGNFFGSFSLLAGRFQFL